MDANRREWLAENCAVIMASGKYQVSGFQVSGLGIRNQEWSVILELAPVT
jgi:hypothetical protein